MKKFCKYRHNILKVGRRKDNYSCNECARIRSRKWAKENPGKRVEVLKKWRQAHPDRVREISWKSIGIKFTYKKYKNMFNRQDGKCAVCFKHQSEFNHPLNVDHDHKTGKIRGLVCNNHNRMLGFAHDSISELQMGINYLKILGYKMGKSRRG